MEVEKTEPGNNFNVLVLLGSLFSPVPLPFCSASPHDFYFKPVSVGPFQEDGSCWEELTQNSGKLYYECCLSTTSSRPMTCEQSTVPESCEIDFFHPCFPLLGRQLKLRMQKYLLTAKVGSTKGGTEGITSHLLIFPKKESKKIPRFP